MGNLPKWLKELREEAQEIEKNQFNEIIEDSDEMDELMFESALDSEGRFDEEIFNLSYSFDSKEKVSDSAQIAFLYSAIQGLEEKIVSDIKFNNFYTFLFSQLEVKEIDIRELLGTIQLTAKEEDLLRNQKLMPWQLSVKQIKKLQELVNCSLSDLLSSIRATFPVPSSMGTVLARSDTRLVGKEQQQAQEISTNYIAFKRELKKKYQFLAKLQELS